MMKTLLGKDVGKKRIPGKGNSNWQFSNIRINVIFRIRKPGWIAIKDNITEFAGALRHRIL